MIRIETVTDALEQRAEKIALMVEDGSFDAPVDAAAMRCHAELVGLTPKRWTGMLRRNWAVEKTGPGSRKIWNTADGKTPNKIMLFIEEGTGNAGTPTSHGGRIYSKSGGPLFIPLNARASIGGWDPSLKYGVDYILRKSVRGIKARYIVRKFRPRAQEILATQMKSFLAKALT
jgi:hypothetical protein